MKASYITSNGRHGPPRHIYVECLLDSAAFRLCPAEQTLCFADRFVHIVLIVCYRFIVRGNDCSAPAQHEREMHLASPSMVDRSCWSGESQEAVRIRRQVLNQTKAMAKGRFHASPPQKSLNRACTIHEVVATSLKVKKGAGKRTPLVPVGSCGCRLPPSAGSAGSASKAPDGAIPREV